MSCVYSVVHVFRVMEKVILLTGDVHHTNPGTGFPHCQYQNIKIPEHTKLKKRTPPSCDTKAI